MEVQIPEGTKICRSIIVADLKPHSQNQPAQQVEVVYFTIKLLAKGCPTVLQGELLLYLSLKLLQLPYTSF